jgi:hypothetical protein
VSIFGIVTIASFMEMIKIDEHVFGGDVCRMCREYANSQQKSRRQICDSAVLCLMTLACTSVGAHKISLAGLSSAASNAQADPTSIRHPAFEIYLLSETKSLRM